MSTANVASNVNHNMFDYRRLQSAEATNNSPLKNYPGKRPDHHFFFRLPEAVQSGRVFASMQNSVEDVMKRRARSRLFTRDCCFSEKKSKLLTMVVMFGGLFCTHVDIALA